MDFNSSIFILSFLVFYLVYHETAVNPRIRIWLILVFNAVFYWLLSGAGLLVIACSGLADFMIGRAIHRSHDEHGKRVYLLLSVFMNILLILGFRHFTQWFGLGAFGFWPAVAGISFLVFRSLGYVLDIYREQIEEPETNPAAYMAYIGFFPLILQGPISPARDFLPELKKPFASSDVPLGEAFFLLSSGILKKFALAAYLTANFTDRVFDSPHLFTGMENLIAAIGQTLVVFLDFSGYTDMMLGLGLLLGFRLAENFNFPFTAVNISEYWRRWHMSLSQWLNEYLFFPLSFSLRAMKQWGTITAVMITFTISGFWHGTSLNYTLWGIMHGIALSWDVVSAGMRAGWKKRVPPALYRGISILLTFAFLVFSGIYFRQEDLHTANDMLLRIFNHADWSLFAQWVKDFGGVLLVIINVLLLHWLFPGIYADLKSRFSALPWIIHVLVLCAVIFVSYQVSGMEPVPFIYQKF